TAVYVGIGQTMTLPGGNYGALKIDKGGTLNLSGGTYCFASWKGIRGVDVIVNAPSTIIVTGTLRSGNGSLLAPGPNVPVSSIHLFVGGNIVKFGHRSNTSAILYQPNGTLRLGRFNSFKGQFIAKVIRSDFGDAFTLYSCGNGIVDPGEQ